MNRREALAIPLLLLASASETRAQCASLGVPGGTGCPPFGPPTLSCVGPPAAGNLNFKVTTNLVGPYPSVLLAGNCASPPYPVSASFLCTLLGLPCATTGYVDLTAFFPVLGLAPGFLQPVEFPFPIEGDPALVGYAFCAQAIALYAANPCILVTNGLAITIQ